MKIQNVLPVLKQGKFLVYGMAAIVAGLTVYSSFFTVAEGHVGIVTRWSKAIYQTGPGIHFKIPYVDGVEHMEVRQRKNTEKLAAGTANLLPATATVSINWTVNPEAALDIYKRYGSLNQFEDRILDPKLRQAAKAAISKFEAAELIRNRNNAVSKILEYMVSYMEPFPVTINSPQIEDIAFPAQYQEAVLAKERAREAAIQQQHILNKQALEAQQVTKIAEAERDARRAKADGVAYQVRVEAEAQAEAIRLTGKAEAEKIRLIVDAMAKNPQYVELERVRQWNGSVPRMLFGENSPGFLFNLDTSEQTTQ